MIFISAFKGLSKLFQEKMETERLCKRVVELERQLCDSVAEETWLREKAEEFRKSVLLMVTTRDLRKVPEFTLGKRPVVPVTPPLRGIDNSESNAVQLKKREAELQRKLRNSRKRYAELKVKVDNFRKNIITLTNEEHAEDESHAGTDTEQRVTETQEDASDSEHDVSVPVPSTSSRRRSCRSGAGSLAKKKTVPLISPALSSSSSDDDDDAPVTSTRNTLCSTSASESDDEIERKDQGNDGTIFIARKNKQNLYFHCDLCTAKYASPYRLKGHKVAVHKIKSTEIYCLLCAAAFKDRTDLNAHRKKNHTGKHESSENSSQQIGNSKKKFVKDRHGSGKKHGIHPRPGKKVTGFVCLCGSRFKTRKTILEHILAKKRGKIFKCQSCSFRTDKPYSLKIHQKRIHSKEASVAGGQRAKKP